MGYMTGEGVRTARGFEIGCGQSLHLTRLPEARPGRGPAGMPGTQARAVLQAEVMRLKKEAKKMRMERKRARMKNLHSSYPKTQ